MEYQKLLTDLKRYSFKEKMRLVHKYSKQLITPIGVANVDRMRQMPLPWNLETFVLLAVRSIEWKEDDFVGKRENTFLKMIDCIAAYIHPVLEKYRGTAFAEYFMLAEFPLQFDIQEFYPYKFYRYHYYFNFSNDHINMKDIFRRFFGCEYYDYLIVVQFLWLLFSTDAFVPYSVYKELMDKYPIVFQNLSITREEYIKELDHITEEIPDYKYCLRPSYSFPFIIGERILYLPLPHLLIRSITSSLLYRITDGNDKLATDIGKEVFEPYLFDIIKRSGLFDEVIPEKRYRKKKLEQRTIDVMTRKNNYYLFFDSKSYSPKRDLRIFSDIAFTNEIERLAKAYKQVYLHIHDKFPKEYNFFHYHASIDIDNVFGIIVVKEHPHIFAEHIYKKAAELTNIVEDSPEYDWMCKHIGIVSIYDVEKFCFTSSDIISAVCANRNSGRINDLWLSVPILNDRLTNKDVKHFKHELSETANTLARELLKQNNQK